MGREGAGGAAEWERATRNSDHVTRAARNVAALVDSCPDVRLPEDGERAGPGVPCVNASRFPTPIPWPPFAFAALPINSPPPPLRAPRPKNGPESLFLRREARPTDRPNPADAAFLELGTSSALPTFPAPDTDRRPADVPVKLVETQRAFSSRARLEFCRF